MNSFSHWDYAEEFSGDEAAYLIAGLDPSLKSTEADYKVRSIISRMKKAYYTAVGDLTFEVMNGALALIDKERHHMVTLNPAKNRQPKDNVLWSVEIEEMIDTYNICYREESIPDDFEYCQADVGNITADEIKRRDALWGFDLEADVRRGQHWVDIEFKIVGPLFLWAGEYIHEFGDQKFSRGELHRWITENKFPTEYTFAIVAVEEKADQKKDVLSARERNNLLLIIAALANECSIDHAGRHAASEIAAMVDKLGGSLSAETVRSKLDSIPDVLGRKLK